MIPKTLSASAALSFQGCPARYYAENILRAPSPDNSAASLGTDCHGAMEDYVLSPEGIGAYQHGDHEGAWEYLARRFTFHYDRDFETRERYDEGLEMLRRWFDRQNWIGRTVLSAEVKESIPFDTSIGPINFNYIMDRVDRLDVFDDDGSLTDEFDIEVVDYKTIALPVQPGDLRNKIQARCYSMAARMRYPNARHIWVTFDLLRHDVVSARFSVDDDRDTWSYIANLFEKIIAEPEPGTERLNDTCRFCVRRHVCKTLNNHAEVGGVLGLSMEEAAKRRGDLTAAMSTMTQMQTELDAILLGYAEETDQVEWVAGDVNVNITAKRVRNVDAQMAARILTPDMLAKYGNLTMKGFDNLIKSGELTDEQVEQMRSLITYKTQSPSVKITPVNPIDQEA